MQCPGQEDQVWAGRYRQGGLSARCWSWSVVVHLRHVWINTQFPSRPNPSRFLLFLCLSASLLLKLRNCSMPNAIPTCEREQRVWERRPLFRSSYVLFPDLDLSQHLMPRVKMSSTTHVHSGFTMSCSLALLGRNDYS